MKVMVLVKATADSEAGKMPSQQLLEEMGDYNEALSEAGILLARAVFFSAQPAVSSSAFRGTPRGATAAGEQGCGEVKRCLP